MSGLFSKIVDRIDYFVGDNYLNDPDLTFKVRLLVSCLLYFIVGVILLAPYYVTIENVNAAAEYSYYFTAIPGFIFWFWLLYLLKQGKAYNFAAHSTIFVTILMFFGGILVTGGPMETEMLPLLIVPVVLAFLLLGQRAGVLWAVLVAAVNYIMVLAGHFGFEYVNFPPEEAREALRVFNWTTFFLTVVALVTIFETMNRRLTDERNLERDRFRHMAMHDPLTGLPNRKYFDDKMVSSIAMAERTGMSLAVGLMDLNDFKPINDKIGHDAGDIVLRVVSDRISRLLRKSDHFARLGGDEFGLILTNVKIPQDIERVANNVLTEIAKPIQLNDEGSQRISISGSIGFAVYPLDTKDENELRTFSDKAMYEAKNSKTGWRMYHEIKS